MDHSNPGPAPQVDLEASGLVILAGPVVVRPPVEVVGIGVGEAATGIMSQAPLTLRDHYRTHCAPIRWKRFI